MKKEASAKSKKWLWLVIALVAILAVAGVLVAVLLGGGNQDDGNATPNSKLYWNVDKNAFLENSETGLTTRERADDGFYHVRLVTGGELIEVLVDDGRLINYIDTLDALGLVFDADGMVVDALDPSQFHPEIVRDFFVKRITDTSITVNSSIAMNGMDMTFDLSTVGVYDVTASAAQPGMPGIAGLMDSVYIFGDMDGNAQEIFITSRAENAEVYWAMGGYYNKNTGETTRIPDENGVYTVDFAYKGEIVQLKCKDKSLVNTFDKSGRIDNTFGLQFDEEGYIVKTISTQMALRGMMLTNRYHIDQWDGKTFHANGYIGNDSGKEATATLRDDCEVYLVCDNGTVNSHIGEKTELQNGDRILCFTDLEGKAKLIFVLNRLVDSPLYFNLDRNWSNNSLQSLRKPDENGYYNVRFAVNGKLKTFRTKDKALMDAIDKPEYCGVGLKLRGDIIEKVYDQESVTSTLPAGYGRYITNMAGTIISAASLGNPQGAINKVLPDGVKIYNVSKDMDGEKIGQETELRMWDRVNIFCTLKGVSEIYITNRYHPDYELYYNLEAKWNKETKETTRTPNAEGYYVIPMAHNGKQVEVKTKSKEMCSYIDTMNPKYMALKVDKNGNVKYACESISLVKGGYWTSTSYYYRGMEGNKYMCYYKSGEEWKLASAPITKGDFNPPIYNISASNEKYIGEKTTLRLEDMPAFLIDRMDGGKVYYGYIITRKMDIDIAYNKTRMYNTTTKETTRTPDADGYYVFELAVDGKVKQYKTKDKDIASRIDSYSAAFSIKLKGDLIQSAHSIQAHKDISTLAVGRFDVTSIKGNTITFTRNRPTSTNLGSTIEKVLAKNYKAYDFSPYAKQWGAEVKLGLGDRVEAYANKDGELVFFSIIYKCTRKEGPISKCDHCGEKVWWEPYVGENYNVPDIHYYFPGETTVTKAFTIGANERPLIANGTNANASKIITAYKGVVFDSDRMGINITVADTNPIAEKANAQTFPSDGSDYEAMCYACNEKVVWKAMTNAVWHKVYNPNYVTNDENNVIHTHFYVPNDFTMSRTDKALIDHWVASVDSTMCIHLNGKEIKTKGQITIQKSILNIMGNGVIDADCTAASNVANATIYINNSSGRLNLYGGIYRNSSTRHESSYVFDMNGQKAYGAQKFATVYGTLDILDTVGGGFISTKSASGAYGGVIVVGDRGVVNMHSGTLTYDSPEAAGTGGIVNVNAGGTFNMLGGKIVDGYATNGGNVSVTGTFNYKKGSISGGKATNNGGNVYVYMGGTFNMPGNTISGGTAAYAGNVYVGDSTFNMTGGTIKDGIATSGGGNFRVMDNSVINISGGTVTGGKAAFGGNFAMQATNNKLDADGKQVYATINLKSGTVSDGTATGSGGNFYAANNSKINHIGGIISGGSANPGGAIAVNASVTTRLNLGGTITGGDVYVSKNGTTTLTGKAKIDSLILVDGAKVTLDNLADEAKINVDATGAFTNANDKASDYKNIFESLDSTKFINEKEGVLYCDVTPTECPICHEVTSWKKISDYTNRISGTLGFKHWIIDKDTTYSGDIANAVIFNKTSTLTMCINMNGKTLTSHNGIQINAGTVNLFGGGTFINTSESTSSSIGVTAMYLGEGATVNVSDDIVIKSAVPTDSAVLFAGSATLNLNSGAKLEGDVVVNAGTPTVNVNTGATVNGDVIGTAGTTTLNVNGGTINGTTKVYQGTTVLDGAANVARIETGVQGMLNVKSTFTGTAVVDFPVYEAIDAEPGYGYAYTFNATVDGEFTGTLMSSEGKQFAVVATDVGGTTVYRLKVETTKTKLNGNEIAAAAETMAFPTGVANNTVVTAFCPACNKVVNWKAIKGNNQRILMNRYANAHLYMSEDMTKSNVNSTGDYAIFASSHKDGGEHNTACLHFNGKTYTANSEIQIDTGSATVKKMTMSLMGKGKYITDLSSTNNSYNRSILRIGANSTASSMNVYSVTLESTHPTKPGISYYGVNGVLNLYGQTTITVPETATEMASSPVGHFNDYRYTLVDGVLTVTGAKATEQPAWLTQKESITKIVLGEKVTTVAENAFKDCANVTEVSMTNKITSIGNDAFAGCTGITKAEYLGNETEWAAVTVGTGNEPLTSKIVCHIHNYTPVVTPATCTEDGYTTYTCNCGDSYVDDKVTASGHGTANAEGRCPVCNIILDVPAYAAAMTFPTDGSNSEQLCPHCDKVVVWKAAPKDKLVKNDYDHYYLSGDSTITDTQLAVQVNSTYGPSIQTLCLHFNGHTINSKGGIVAVSRNLNLMGNGGLHSDCTATGGWNAFAVRMWGNGYINIYGGSYVLDGNYNSIQFRDVGASQKATISVYPGTSFTRGGSAAELGYSGTNTKSNCTFNDYR